MANCLYGHLPPTTFQYIIFFFLATCSKPLVNSFSPTCHTDRLVYKWLTSVKKMDKTPLIVYMLHVSFDFNKGNENKDGPLLNLSPKTPSNNFLNFS
ncbi:MAG: hypothetical protein DRJ05_02945 [Bacteroidetes bacterium]|nr:MAG: hypothetical protein DRJ05_02945 [Bacteroidota bacterium]